MPEARRPDPSLEDDRWFTSADARRYLGIAEITLSRWIASGKLKAYRIGGPRGELRFRRADLDAALEPVDPAARAAVFPTRRSGPRRPAQG